MLRVRSLSRTIVLQFAAILIPVGLVLLYQLTAGVARAQAARFERQCLVLAQHAQTEYRTFLNGLVDAVDTGRAGARTQQALAETGASLQQLHDLDDQDRLEPLLAAVAVLEREVGADPTVGALLVLRPTINDVRALTDALVVRHDERVQRNLAEFANDTQRQGWIVAVAMAITFSMAVGSIYRLGPDSAGGTR